MTFCISKRPSCPSTINPFPGDTTIISANAYLGADAVAEVLDRGADVVLTGRVADPSLFLGALIHAFGWEKESWDLMSQGTAVGHLLECAGQLTGGYFADPGYKDVQDLDRLGFPLAEVSEDGSALLTKVDGSGGLITLQTCREQILYEVLDPSSYITPDVIADFTEIRFEQQTPGAIRVSGAQGKPRPQHYKVSIGVDDGLIAEGQISYAGPGALARAELARQILEKRLAQTGSEELRIDLIGLSSMHGTPADWPAPYEVRLRATARFRREMDARRLTREVESLYLNGPAAGAGVTFAVRENIAIVPALIAGELVTPSDLDGGGMMELRSIAHARAGDKGSLVNIAVFAYRDEDYAMLVEHVTEERVSELFREHITRPVTRYCVPNLCGLNFVLQRRPTDSVTRSLRLDAHGKSLSSLMLSLEI